MALFGFVVGEVRFEEYWCCVGGYYSVEPSGVAGVVEQLELSGVVP